MPDDQTSQEIIQNTASSLQPAPSAGVGATDTSKTPKSEGLWRRTRMCKYVAYSVLSGVVLIGLAWRTGGKFTSVKLSGFFDVVSSLATAIALLFAVKYVGRHARNDDRDIWADVVAVVAAVTMVISSVISAFFE